MAVTASSARPSTNLRIWFAPPSYDTISDMYKGALAVTSQFRVHVLEYNDRYVNPMSGGYRDLQFAVEVDGHVCEDFFDYVFSFFL